MANKRQGIAKAFFLTLAAFFLPLAQALSEPHFIDLSKAANRGLAESFDEAFSGIKDLQEKNGLKDMPVGPQTFRGVPFQVIDPAKNQGRSFVVLKSRRKPDFPDGVSIPTGNLKASYLYFLHTCRWGGTAQNITVAEYDIVYDDGQVSVIPLRVGVEFTNFFGADDTASSFLAWWHKYKNTEMGVNLFPWKNPRPDQAIQSILFKSRGNMPVPMLFSITASDKELPISPDSPKPEKTFQTDTSKWIPFEPSDASPVSTAIDMSFLLDAPAGKHGKVKADGDKLAFEDGTPARFWGINLLGAWWDLSDEQLEKLAVHLATLGCNLVTLNFDVFLIETHHFKLTAERLDALFKVLKSKGIYVDLTHIKISGTKMYPDLFENLKRLFADEVQITPTPFPFAPALFQDNVCSSGLIYRNDLSENGTALSTLLDLPMVMYPETSIPLHLSYCHSLGTPYRAEWRNGWPNEYLGETPLLVSAYGSFGNWGRCIGMGFSGEASVTEMKMDVDISNKPVLSIQWPVAALAYLRGDLKEGRIHVLETRDEMPDINTSLKTLAHRSGLIGANEKIKTDILGELKTKVNEKTKSFVSDTGQISWQGNVGVVQINSPRFQALIGFLSHRKFNNAFWAAETPNPFVSLSIISLNKGSISLSDHLLVTGVTRMENTGQIYNAAKTKLISPGKAPILMEPLSAKFVLYRPKADPKLKIRALDANGQPLKSKVSAKWVKNSFVFSWIPSAFYLEIFK